MHETSDIKKLSTDELYKKLQTIDSHISIAYSSSQNYNTIDLLRFYKQEILEELSERASVAMKEKPLKKNLTNDSLSQEEEKTERSNDRNDRFRK